MEERTINEKESITIIASMIERTKQRHMLGDGNVLLLWGYLTVAVSLLVWVTLALTKHPAANWLWFLIWIVGGTATKIMEKKRLIRKGAKSYTDKITSKIWYAVGFCAIASTLFCLTFMLALGANAWGMMLVFALLIIPFALIAEGTIINEKSIVVGGYAGLLAGIFTMCCIAGQVSLTASWYMPLFISAFTCMMIIPGHVINHKAKKAQ